MSKSEYELFLLENCHIYVYALVYTDECHIIQWFTCFHDQLLWSAKAYLSEPQLAFVKCKASKA
jgi:hypothetical protein